MGEQVAAGIIWGCSSVGRAPALQAGGHEFESHHLHASNEKRDPGGHKKRNACIPKIVYEADHAATAVTDMKRAER